MASPAALGHVRQRRRQTVDVVADVAVVAEEQAALVSRLAAALAHRAVQAAPALLQHHAAHRHAHAVRVVALTALGAADQAILRQGRVIASKRKTRLTN